MIGGYFNGIGEQFANLSDKIGILPTDTLHAVQLQYYQE
jgi:hypothetical protein